MRIPVLLVVKPHNHYRKSAESFLAGAAMGIEPKETPSYPGVQLDPTFSAIPLAESAADTFSAAAVVPKTSSRFIVRGHIEAKDSSKLPKTAGDAEVFSDPRIATCTTTTCGGTAPVGTAATVANKLNLSALAARKLQGQKVAIAIVDTGINLKYLTNKLRRTPALDAPASWNPPGNVPAPGQWPVNHGTMCAFDALIAAPKATLVDFPVLSAHYPGSGSIMSGTLSAAIAAYGYMLGSRTNGALSRYAALIASNSWGIFHPSWDFPAGHPGRYCDNPRHPFNVQIRYVTRAGIDVVFAAGNCGAPCADGRCQGRTTGAIMGASAVREVLTIAGCDTNDLRVGYSSQGPSIPGMFKQKPDVTSYTHFLGSEAFGLGSPDSGTSAACPVAAGVIAALRSSPKIPPATLPTASLFQALRGHTTVVGAAGWNGDYGFGILNPLAAATALNL
ncbi:MAG: S8 family serine peptidase [Limisphaerales bacterium]